MKKILYSTLVILAANGTAYAQNKKAPAKSPAVASKPVMKNLLDSFSYAAGINIGNNMKEQGISSMNYGLLVKAIEDVFKKNPPAMTTEQSNSTLQAQMAVFNKKKEEESKKLTVAEKAKGEAFLAQNKTRKEVTTLPNGLQYEIITPGDPAGMKPTAQDTVVVDYIGKLTNGVQFDASTDRGPATFPLGGVIKGWTEILQLMTKGAHWRVYIPSDLAYGDRGAGAQIPGGSTLIFDITLLEIKPAQSK